MLLRLLLLLVIPAAASLPATPAAPVTSSSVAPVVESAASSSSTSATALILAAVAMRLLLVLSSRCIAHRVGWPTAAACRISAAVRHGRRRLAARVGLRTFGDGSLSLDVGRRHRGSRGGRSHRSRWNQCLRLRRRSLPSRRRRRRRRRRGRGRGLDALSRRRFDFGDGQRGAACFDFVAVRILGCFSAGRVGRTAAAATTRWASTFAHANGSTEKVMPIRRSPKLLAELRRAKTRIA